jgi:hypothetical protein
MGPKLRPVLAEVLPVSSEFSRNRDVVTRAERAQTVESLTMQMAHEFCGRSLELVQAASTGSKDSAHDVFSLRTTERDANGKRQQIAVKRFRRWEKAVGEMRAIQTASERGLRTPQPYGKGIYNVDEVGTLLVTKYIPRFTTMNQVAWRDYYAGQDDYNETIAPTLRSIGTYIGKMHLAGMTHHDLQLKNIAQIPPKEFVTFDLEGATFFDPLFSGSVPTFEQEGKMVDDVNSLAVSLVDKGFLWNASDERFGQELTEHLIMPYIEETRMMSDNFLEGLDSVILNAQLERSRMHNGQSRFGS